MSQSVVPDAEGDRRNPGDEKVRAIRPQGFARPFFCRGLVTVTRDGLSEKGQLVV